MLSHRFAILPLLAILGAGCSSEPYKVAPVSGRITLNGKALAGVAVMYQPVATESTNNPGPGSTGITDADGRYTLTLVGKQRKGAVVGKHKVRITPFDSSTDSSDDTPRRVKPSVFVPAKYNEREARLEFDVPAKGSSSADFDLTP